MNGPTPDTSGDLRRLVATERTLVRVRWFAVAFGLFQVWQLSGTLPVPPGYVVPASYASIAALGLGNVLVSRLTGRTSDLRSLRRIGFFAFGLDMAVVFANIWFDSYDRNATIWNLAYVLPLEGAIRYQLTGAASSIAVFFVSEFARELYRMELFPDLDFEISAVTFRVGVFAIIAFVGGTMARQLEQERVAAETRADEVHRMARREGAARSEIQAFHDVVLAGLEGDTVEDTIARIVTAMQRAYGYEAFAIGLIEGPERGVRMVGSVGFPDRSIGRSLPAGNGIIGRAIASGRAQLVHDVRADPDYVSWSPAVRSEMAVPLRSGEEIIGIVDVDASKPGAFGDEDAARLERLAGQIGLVISNARLLATQRATVERLRELDAMKSDFIAVTSHELRTPLTAVKGFVKTLRRADMRPERAEMQEFLAIVDRQVERLSRLVEELLLTARIDAGTIDLQMDSVEVSEVLDDTLAELGDARSRVQLALDPSLPRLVTDAQRLGQVARNLIENALKFSPDEQPVRVTAVRDGGSLVLEVADHGTGIPEEELSQIFDRFHQVGGSLRRRGQGLGLGLYIVRNLVEALNGSVGVRSTVGEGSTFSVSIPFVPLSARSSTA